MKLTLLGLTALCFLSLWNQSSLFAAGEPAVTRSGVGFVETHGEHQKYPATFYGPSEYFSGPVAANAKGQIVVIQEDRSINGIHAEEMIVWDLPQGQVTKIGLLDGYSAIEPNGITEEGQVIGFASRVKRPHTQAFIWSPDEGTVGLGFLPNHYASAAQACTDGTIVGHSIGHNDFAPVVWDLNEDGKWHIARLEHVSREGTHGEALGVSPNGNFIVGHDGGKPVVWVRSQNGFERTAIPGVKYGRAKVVNDGGMVGGELNLIEQGQATTQVFIWKIGSKVTALPHQGKNTVGSRVDAIDTEGRIGGHFYEELGRKQRAFLWSSVSGFQFVRMENEPYGAIGVIKPKWIIGQTLDENSDTNRLFVLQVLP